MIAPNIQNNQSDSSSSKIVDIAKYRQIENVVGPPDSTSLTFQTASISSPTASAAAGALPPEGAGSVVTDADSPTGQNSGSPKMDDMAREWVNARLEATEERMNARLAGIESAIHIAVGKLDGLSGQIGDAKNEAVRAHDEAVKARDAALNNRWFFIGTAISLAAVIAAMLAYGAQNFDSALAAVQAILSAKGSAQ